jgi:TctA family transporter
MFDENFLPLLTLGIGSNGTPSVVLGNVEPNEGLVLFDKDHKLIWKAP